MGGNVALIKKNVWQNPKYRQAFQRYELGIPTADNQITTIATAITAYVASLAPLNSPFDRYAAGERNAMSRKQIKGFNLFMGKAQCGTCHFMPYFNSLLPPLYNVSEIEILGTPVNDQLIEPVADPDLGRYVLYPIRYYRRAFKTPTVRNAQMTAPYMHNGGFKTLKSVLEFYNKGGGNGIGLLSDEQTLSSRPLKLSNAELDQIAEFINSLTDGPIKSRPLKELIHD